MSDANPIRTLARLIWPLSCLGCGKWDEHLCDKCVEKLEEHTKPQLVDKEFVDVLVFAAGSYQAELREMILNWKDHGREDATPFIQNLFSRAVQAFLESDLQLAMQSPGQPSSKTEPQPQQSSPQLTTSSQSPLYIVPAPSGKASLSRRGRLQTLELATAAKARLQHLGIRAEIANILLQTAKKKQVNFNSSARGANKSDSIKLNQRGVKKLIPKLHSSASVRNIEPESARINCILVDDIITTGATANECVKALKTANFNPLAVIAIAST